MSAKRSILVTRPYDSVEAFLEGDSWTVDRTDIVLVEAEPLPDDTAVRFEIALRTGGAIVVGEGRVTGTVPASDGRQAGVRVRLQKLAGSSKDVLKRALETQRRKGRQAAAAPPRSAPEAAPIPEAIATPGTAATPGAAPAPPPDEPVATASKPDAAPHTEAGPEIRKSGVRNRLAAATPPANRDELLARLRERAKTVKTEVFFEKRTAAAE